MVHQMDELFSLTHLFLMHALNSTSLNETDGIAMNETDFVDFSLFGIPMGLLSRFSDSEESLEIDMTQFDILEEAVRNCTGRAYESASSYHFDTTITHGKATPTHGIHNSLTVFTALLDEKKFGKPFSALVRLAHKFGYGDSDYSKIHNDLKTRNMEIVHQLGIVSNAVDSLPDKLKSALRLKEYINQRDEIFKVNDSFVRLIDDLNSLNVDGLKDRCDETDGLVDTLDTIDNMVEDSSHYFGDLVGMLVVAASRDRREYIKLAADIKDDLCRLAYLHSVCSAVKNDPEPLRIFHNDWMKNKTTSIVRRLEEAELHIVQNFRIDAQNDLNRIKDSDVWNAKLIHERMQQKYYWLDVTVLSYTTTGDSEDTKTTKHIESAACIIQREVDNYNAIVYFSDKSRKTELQKFLETFAQTVHAFPANKVLPADEVDNDPSLSDCRQYTASRVAGSFRSNNPIEEGTLPAVVVSQSRTGVWFRCYPPHHHRYVGLVGYTNSSSCYVLNCATAAYLTALPYCTI